jgi:hypothetical protein
VARNRPKRDSSLSFRAYGPRNVMKIARRQASQSSRTLTPLISARLGCDPGFFEPALGMTAQDTSVCRYGQ